MSSTRFVTAPHEDGGYRHVLRIALPLVVSTSSSTVMQFVDRMFLGWYSGASLAAALSAGLLVWTCTSLFFGAAAYTSTFVAQYYGSGQPGRVGAAVWQGVLLAVLSWVVLAACAVLAPWIIGLMGHSPEIACGEMTYFRTLMFASGFYAISAALSSFYSGTGRTRTIMTVETGANAVNFFLAYGLVFGKWGLPELGIKGAATATASTWCLTAVVYACLMRFGRAGRAYSLLRHPRLELSLLWRMVRYGVPSGLHGTVDLVAFTTFVALVGRLGKPQLEAVGVAFSINGIAFLPMMGLATATSVLVGRFVAAGLPGMAQRATRRAFIITFVYMVSIAAVFWFLPDPLVRLFRPRQSEADFPAVMAYATVLLKFIAVYSLFDSGNLIFAGAIKGAGDTRFVVAMLLVTSISLLIVPTYLIVQVLHLGLYAAMAAATAYVIAAAIAFYLRYRGGKWKSMRVIEPPVPVAGSVGDSPTAT